MKIVAPEDAALYDHRGQDGTGRRGAYYFGEVGRDGGGSRAWLVEVHSRTIKTHFHDADEFQILLGSETARFQLQPLPHLTIHYADAFGVYGPLSGGAPPMRFFTLRADGRECPANKMPGSHDRLRYRGARQRVAEFEALGTGDLPSAGAVVESSLFAPEPDGVEALLVLCGPGTHYTMAPSAATSGQHLFVADGTITFAGSTYGPESIGWQQADEGPVVLVAGPGGARLFVLRYPSPTSTETRAGLEAEAERSDQPA